MHIAMQGVFLFRMRRRAGIEAQRGDWAAAGDVEADLAACCNAAESGKAKP
ncbi:hypothetical protein [Thioclava sp. ES.031]|uniref:hypothetical protein n=1 Tax=Thioclava sp. ES.031 TaxID=1798203 RepID=UPI0015968E4F|nr:hypothetical protein [Thioclava sp. ES.031]